MSLGMMTACTGKGGPEKTPAADGKSDTVPDDASDASVGDDGADTRAEPEPGPGPEVEIYGGPRMTDGDDTAEPVEVEDPPNIYGGPRMDNEGEGTAVHSEKKPQPRIYGAPRRDPDLERRDPIEDPT